MTFAVETRKVAFKYTKMCFFLRTCVLECMKEEGEEGNYGVVVVVLWQHGGHLLGGLVTTYIMACLLKQSDKK